MRAVLKAAVETTLIVSGASVLARRLHAGDVAILAYHNVVDPADAGRGEAGLHLPLPAFLAQLELLRRTHEIVPLEDIGLPRARSRPRAVITFDDGYRGALHLAFPELRRRGIPATVFVAPALLGAGSTWWDELGERGMLDRVTRERALEQLAGRADRIRSALVDGGPPVSLPHSYGIATAEEVLECCGDHIAVGSHTWAHEYLPALEDHETEKSLRQSAEWVRNYPGKRSAWLALPYGAGSRRQARAAIQLGYSGVLRIAPGGLWSGREPEWAQRINVPAGISTRRLDLRMSGLLRR